MTNLYKCKTYIIAKKNHHRNDYFRCFNTMMSNNQPIAAVWASSQNNCSIKGITSLLHTLTSLYADSEYNPKLNADFFNDIKIQCFSPLGYTYQEVSFETMFNKDAFIRMCETFNGIIEAPTILSAILNTRAFNQHQYLLVEQPFRTLGKTITSINGMILKMDLPYRPTKVFSDQRGYMFKKLEYIQLLQLSLNEQNSQLSIFNLMNYKDIILNSLTKTKTYKDKISSTELNLCLESGESKPASMIS